MALGSRVKQARHEAYDLIEQARESGEEALATVGERLGVYRPAPASTGGEDGLAFINGLLLGAAICAAIAYLLAPTDGETLRHRLKGQIDALLGRASIEETERAAAAASGSQYDATTTPAPAATGATEPVTAGAERAAA